MVTVAQALFRNARRVPRREALVTPTLRQTYAELDARVNQFANALAASGLKKGDRLALMSPNKEGFVYTYYAALRLGLIHVSVNPRMAAPEVTYLLDDSGARGFVYDSSLTEVAQAAVAAAAHGPAVVLTADATGAADSLVERADRSAADDPGVDVSEADDAEILYTSGTTGQPKGVLLDHHRVTWAGVNINMAVGIRDGDTLLHVAPLYHSAELNLFLNGGMLVGARHVLLPAFEPAAVLDAMERERVDAFFGVPTMYKFMLAQPDFPRRDLAAWRIGMFGAAPMPPSLIEALARAAPNVRLYNLCGPTECGPGGIMLGGGDLFTHPGANGWGFINTEVRVVDDAGRDVEAGGVGEIIVRGETTMKRYWNKPEATAKTLRDGWVWTGDIGRIAEDGCITLVDRKKDMIITGGMNVYSVEVENALAAHPDVLDCAVIGVPHPDYGESILAVVTPREGAIVTLDGLRRHARTLISDYKLPHRLVIGAVPRNPSGKILKHVLRARLSKNPDAA
ncbi:MAG: o-succinylbenzoate--CoA ligase [Nevskiaceae bacterium]|nr:MAG: o-succinylbenzoate--CoA ligase [Nevskiaceae bacterium]TBR72609.1 MAG: o-succinylbenzoate--CoA ligase [Nevskiaceae bacterium]